MHILETDGTAAGRPVGVAVFILQVVWWHQSSSMKIWMKLITRSL